MIVRGRHPRLRQFLAAMAFLAPALILFVVFVGYPAIDAFRVGTQDWTGFSPRAKYVGARHYVNLFGRSAIEALPWLLAATAAAVAGMALGKAWTRSLNARRIRRGNALARWSGLALAGALVGALVVWTYGPSAVGFLQQCRLLGKNFELAFGSDGDSYFRSCVKNNFTFMIVGGAFHLVYAFVFAAALALPNFRGKVFYRTMIFFPSFISAVGVAMLWKQVYDTRAGLLNFLLQLCRIDPIEWLSGQNMLNSIIVCGVWSGVGSTMILLLAGMQRIPETYYEAARIDGAGEGQVLRHVTLPLLRDVILIVVTLWVIGSLKIFGLVQAFAIAADETYSVISVRQYELAFSNRDNIYMMGYATAMAVVLLILVVVFAVGLRSLRQPEQVEY